MNYDYELWVEPKDKIEYIDKSITCIRDLTTNMTLEIG